MNRFSINKKEINEILENVAFTKRERDIFEKLVEGQFCPFYFVCYNCYGGLYENCC